jgi:hypothetical protein
MQLKCHKTPHASISSQPSPSSQFRFGTPYSLATFIHHIISFILITAMASSIRSDSNSIPLSPRSLTSSWWSLDSEDLQRHAELQNILYPQTPPAARLSMKCSHYFSKQFTIGDAVHFQESTQLFTFLGYTGKVTYDDVGQEEYEAEFQAPYRTNPPTSIHFNLHRKPSKDRIWLASPLLRPIPRTRTRDIGPVPGTRSFRNLRLTSVYPEITSDLRIFGSHPAFLS